MIGADEYTIDTQHGVTIICSRNKALRDACLARLADDGWRVSGNTVQVADAVQHKSAVRVCWRAWADYKE